MSCTSDERNAFWNAIDAIAGTSARPVASATWSTARCRLSARSSGDTSLPFTIGRWAVNGTELGSLTSIEMHLIVEASAGSSSSMRRYAGSWRFM